MASQSALKYEVLPGGLSQADQAAIFDLAEKGWKASRIGRELRKHPSTIMWFMYRNGLAAPGSNANRKPYKRGNRTVYPFTPAEDAFLVEQRVKNVDLIEIARLASALFGTERCRHVIEVRLVMLASREEAA